MTSCVIIFTQRVKCMTRCYIILEEADRMSDPHWPEGVTVTGPAVTGAITPTYLEVLTPAALNFVAKLQRPYDSRRLELLTNRAERQQKIDRGDLPDFLPETAHIRSNRSWHVAPIPPDLQRRHVEITAPTHPKALHH